jgi:hypothetical protein
MHCGGARQHHCDNDHFTRQVPVPGYLHRTFVDPLGVAQLMPPIRWLNEGVTWQRNSQQLVQ